MREATTPGGHNPAGPGRATGGAHADAAGRTAGRTAAHPQGPTADAPEEGFSATEAPAFTVGGVFSGLGGFELGFMRQGADVKWSVESEPYCQKVLRQRFPNARHLSDIRGVSEEDLEPVDVVVGGFPCQDLSVAGRREGLKGERSGLFYEAIRVVRAVRPEFVVLENVPGLLSSNGGRDFAAVLDALGFSGALDISWRILDAQYFGVPQRRRRVFVVADFGAFRAEKVLSDEGGLRRDTPALRQKGPEPAPILEVGARTNGDGHRDGDGIGSPGDPMYTLQATKQHAVAPPESADSIECRDGRTRGGVVRSVKADSGEPQNPADGAETEDFPPGSLFAAASSREAADNRPTVAALTADGVGTCGADDNQSQAGHLVAVSSTGARKVVNSITRRYSKGADSDVTETLVCHGGEPSGGEPSGGERPAERRTTHALTSEGHDASEDGTGRGTPLVATNMSVEQAEPAENDCGPALGFFWHRHNLADTRPVVEGVPPLTTGEAPAVLLGVADSPAVGEPGEVDTPGTDAPGADAPSGSVSFSENLRNEVRTSGVHPALTSGGGKPGQGYPAVAVRTAQSSSNGWGVAEESAHTLDGGCSQAVTTGPDAMAFEPRHYAESADRRRVGGAPSVQKSHPLGASDYKSGDAAQAVCYQESQYGVERYGTAGTLRSGRVPEHQMVVEEAEDQKVEDRREVRGAEAFAGRGREGGLDFESSGEKTSSLRGASGGSSRDYVAYQCQGGSVGPSGTLRAGNGSMTGGIPFGAFGSTASDSTPSGAAPPPEPRMAVRRLIPLECERLQGFPDRWTDIEVDGRRLKELRVKGGFPKGKAAASDDRVRYTIVGSVRRASDAARYKALGNAVCVAVVEYVAAGIREALAEGRRQ